MHPRIACLWGLLVFCSAWASWSNQSHSWIGRVYLLFFFFSFLFRWRPLPKKGTLKSRKLPLMILVCSPSFASWWSLRFGYLSCCFIFATCCVSENASLNLGKGEFLTPRKDPAAEIPNLCTPDTFKSPMNFSSVTVEQLGITPESFVKSPAGKRDFYWSAFKV